MNLWYKKSILFLLAGISYLAGQYFRGFWFLGTGIPNVCGHAMSGGVPFCNSPHLYTLGLPLIVLGEVIAAVAVILLFANQRGFSKWLHFSYFYVPIAAILAYLLTGVNLVMGAKVPAWGAVNFFFGYIYAPITLGIVLYEWIRVLVRHYRAMRQPNTNQEA